MPYIGNTVQNQGFTPAVDYFSGNGVTVTFTLSRPVVSVAQMIVAVDNVIQNPSSAYTVSGSSITFTSAPLSGTNNIWVEYTSLITTYNAISQSPSVIGDITASGGYLAVGNFGASFIDGTIVDYTTGNGRITVGPADGLTIYNGGSSARSALLTLNTNGALGLGTSPSYGTAGQVLQSNGSSAAPSWVNLPYTVEYLVVAGGGPGGGISGTGNNGCGGGGAGGAVDSSITVNPGTAYTVTIGAGGTGTSTTGSNGSDSVFNTSTATGGGAGGSSSSLGVAGGSGGGTGTTGGGTTSPGGSGTSGQGYAGGTGNNSTPNYAGGGGGGYGSAGGNGSNTTGGNGGAGLNWKSLGTYYAGGGGGGTYNGGTPGTGGSSIGGAGKTNATSAGNAGTANTGSGGGGSGGGGSATAPNNGGNGGSGVVIIRYFGTVQKGTGGTVTTSGGYTYHTFTTSGTFTA